MPAAHGGAPLGNASLLLQGHRPHVYCFLFPSAVRCLNSRLHTQKICNIFLYTWRCFGLDSQSFPEIRSFFGEIRQFKIFRTCLCVICSSLQNVIVRCPDAVWLCFSVLHLLKNIDTFKNAHSQSPVPHYLTTYIHTHKHTYIQSATRPTPIHLFTTPTPAT